MNQLIAEFREQQARKQSKFKQVERMTIEEKKMLLLGLIQKDDCIIDQCFMDNNIALLIRL